MEKNYHEIALRNKYRFETPRGEITAEDLYDLPLDSKSGMDLDTIAKHINRQLKASEEESFVKTQTKANEELSNKLELVKHVINVKKEEIAKKDKNAANAAKRKLLIEVLESKRQEGIQNMSEEDILAQLAELDKE